MTSAFVGFFNTVVLIDLMASVCPTTLISCSTKRRSGSLGVEGMANISALSFKVTRESLDAFSFAYAKAFAVDEY